ncbi:NEL-type E3 ubiquitin ligase domain-containing protein [Noviherbaspirillum sp. CPCC 100848]|uniref:NEL-type E3 ubiquitin ligase domain-containing protein n=1 Tax=Noviherbaspirillum album TaxID=3080276 RepID=A0ABU6JCB0_9BURK|nr:NEL-type E3 ubiquitin ligase domain-containing protein [Noviherbaspirillum sp. CPCC 100848]MEC4721168.1 NEL-type E3 ubiquitin ligase domain-containing protein [Noviherbaspirillum sp. CPCC 100848]
MELQMPFCHLKILADLSPRAAAKKRLQAPGSARSLVTDQNFWRLNIMLRSLGMALTRSSMRDMLSEAASKHGDTPQMQDSSGAISGKRIDDGHRRHHFFGRKDPARGIGMHRQHKHASAQNRKTIIDIDRRLVAHLRQNSPNASMMPLLDELFSMPFFRKEMPMPEWHGALNNFHTCPMDADETERKNHADDLTNAFDRYVLKNSETSDKGPEREQKLKLVNDCAIQFIQTSNRIEKLQFAAQLMAVHTPPFAEGERCSLQKMALETMNAAFEAITSPTERLAMVTRLTDMLPSLEIHEHFDRSAQYRGLTFLKDWLNKMPVGDAAEATEHLIKVISNLSGRASNLSITGKKPYSPLMLMGFAPTLGAAYIIDHSWARSGNRPKDNALRILREQLIRLRHNWSAVPDSNKEKLKASFAILRTRLNDLSDADQRAVSKILNDSYIDPSNFPAKTSTTSRIRHALSRNAPLSNIDAGRDVRSVQDKSHPGGQLVRFFMECSQKEARLGHNYRGAVTEDLEWPRLNARFIDETGSKQAEIIFSCMGRIEEVQEFRKAGPSQALLLRKILLMAKELLDGSEEFVGKFAAAAEGADANCHNNPRQIFETLWGAVILEFAEQGKFGFDSEKKLLAWAHDQFRREKLHKAITAVATEDFFRRAKEHAAADFESDVVGSASFDKFLSLALETAIANYRAGPASLQKSSILRTTLTQLNKKCAGDVELAPMLRLSLKPDERKLTFLSRLVSEVLETFQLGVEVEQHLAAEVVLGDRLGLWDPADEMSYAATAEKTVERKNITAIENKVRETASSKGDFVDFLMMLAPIKNFVRNNPAYDFKAKVAELSEKLQSDFDIAQDVYFEIQGKPTPEQQEAFDAAGIVYQSAMSEIENTVIRQIIVELLDRYPDVMTITPGRQSFLTSAAGGMKSALHGQETSTEAFLPHPGMFNAFNEKLNRLSAQRAKNSETVAISGQTSAQSAEFNPADALPVSEMYITSEPSSTSRPIYPNDLGSVELVENAGGGDCLFYAIGIEKGRIGALRDRIADLVSGRDDTPQQRAYNAQMVAAAVVQTGLSEDVPNFRQPEIPNDVYAEMVRIPGIYAGEDELCALTQLPEYKGRTVAMIDTDGTIARFRDGVREPVKYTSENFNEVIGDVLADAYIALYKTANHWQRIQPTSQARNAMGE